MDSPSDSPHPHPSAFAHIEAEVRAILSQSLKSFVRASFANVATYRAICGMIAGLILTLVAGLLPLLLTIFLSSSRWVRWVAWPGLTAGLSMIISSSYGVCVGIYIFGDARQLRNFELLRPTIEKTQALAITPIISNTFRPPPSPAEVIRQQWVDQSVKEQKKLSSMISIHSAISSTSHMPSTRSTMDIYISPAIDPDTGEYSPTASFHRVQTESHEMQEFPRTASFIPHEPYTVESQGTKETKSTEQHFEFNDLPDLKTSHETTTPIPSTSAPKSEVKDDLEGGTTVIETNFISSSAQIPQSDPHYGNVAPFGPLTRVLSPVVRRAQWEILIRSTLVGGILSLAIVGALVGIPEVKFMATMPIIMGASPSF